jgi:hypothetical protein
MNRIQTVAFVLLLLSMGVGCLLFVRFLGLLKASADSRTIEDLSHLLVSGSGGIKVELRALSYLLGRKYSAVPDRNVVRAGDYALAAWCVAAALVLVNGLTMGMPA